mgnify:FL=1
MNGSKDFYNFAFIILFLLFISYFTNKKVEGFLNDKSIKNEVKFNVNNVNNNVKQGLKGYNKEDKTFVDANVDYGTHIPKTMINEHQSLSSLEEIHYENLPPVQINAKLDASLAMWTPSAYSGVPHGKLELLGKNNIIEGNTLLKSKENEMEDPFQGNETSNYSLLNNSGSDMGSNEENVEVHFIFAEWCGYSKKSEPDFDTLVENKNVKTSDGKNVVFVKTNVDNDNNKELIKGIFKDVKGYPSYRLVHKGKSFKLNESGRSAPALIEAINKFSTK